MSLAISRVPVPINEPVRNYAPGSAERASLKATLASLSSIQTEMPLVIDGKDVRTGKLGSAVMPHRHAHVLGQFHQGGATEVQAAIDAAQRARAGAQGGQAATTRGRHLRRDRAGESATGYALRGFPRARSAAPGRSKNPT